MGERKRERGRESACKASLSYFLVIQGVKKNQRHTGPLHLRKKRNAYEDEKQEHGCMKICCVGASPCTIRPTTTLAKKTKPRKQREKKETEDNQQMLKHSCVRIDAEKKWWEREKEREKRRAGGKGRSICCSSGGKGCTLGRYAGNMWEEARIQVARTSKRKKKGGTEVLDARRMQYRVGKGW